jgi:uncharacterized alkaline shock family protein YloU
MVVGKPTPYGGINISMEAIASVAGEAASECYGVVGLVSKKSIRENINELLKKDDYIKGIYCRKKKEQYEVDVYIIVAYGVKITEVVSEVQKKVEYVLERTFEVTFLKVNVFVQDIQEIE